MPNMKTEMNHILLTQKIGNISLREYYEQTMNFITRFIEDLRKNTTKKGAKFAQRDFLQKGLKSLHDKSVIRWQTR